MSEADKSTETVLDDTLSISPIFNDPQADIAFISSDNVVFRVYRKALAITTAGFPTSESFIIDEQPVPLEEDSNVLELLFQFIHPRTESVDYRQPMVVDLGPKIFFALAEAAEKYVVFGAMNTCITWMQSEMLHRYPLETLNHAFKHGYTKLADKAAPEVLPYRDDELSRALTCPGILGKWLMYRRHWQRRVEYIIQKLESTPGWEGCHRLNNWSTLFTKATSKDVRNVLCLPQPNLEITCSQEEDSSENRSPKSNRHVLSKPSASRAVTDCLCKRIDSLRVTMLNQAVLRIPEFSQIYGTDSIGSNNIQICASLGNYWFEAEPELSDHWEMECEMQ